MHELEIATAFVPGIDAPDCYEGNKVACGLLAGDVVPGGKIAGALVKIARLLKRAEDASGASRGVWGLPFKDRGYAVEEAIKSGKGLPDNLASNNPVIDSFDFASGRAYSIKSRDIQAGYADPRRLRSELRRDIRQLERFNGQQSWKGVDIRPNQVKARSLLVGIPTGRVTAGQYDAMVDAYNYGRARGVDVEFVIVR